MWIEDYLDSEALAFDNYEDAAMCIKLLVDNGYCAMLSREEHLWLVNWVWTETPADRNDVIFISRSKYECDMYDWAKKHPGYSEEE